MKTNIQFSIFNFQFCVQNKKLRMGEKPGFLPNGPTPRPKKPGFFSRSFFCPSFQFSILLGLMLMIIPSEAVVNGAGAGSQPSAVRTRSPDRRIITDEWAIRLDPDEDPDTLAKDLDAENWGPIGRLPHTYRFRIPGTHTQERSLSAESRLGKESHIQWYEQQIARWRFPRTENRGPRTHNPSDPLFPEQWHLENVGQTQGKSGEDVNVIPVWAQGLTGEGVVIGIADDGLEHAHPDIVLNYREDLSYDFNGRDSDPTPSYYDEHGTSAGGVAAARDNDTCGIGVAYRAGLAGLRLIASENTDADEADALSHHREDIHIYSNSWGPDDDARRLEGPGPLTLKVLEDGIREGRGGLGSIFVWASGNGLRYDDNINYDGYANSRFTIAVGSVDHEGRQTDYGEPGAAMLVTTHSDTDIGGYVGITTTDLLGRRGTATGDCRDNFGGTSASAPLAAGGVALMLQANPTLSWRDVQHILVKSAVRNDPGDNDWTLNAAGLHVNHKYGFGRLDAAAAVSFASLWKTSPTVSTLSYGPEMVSQPIPDNDSEGVSSVITVDQNLKLEHVEVAFNAIHDDRGHLQVMLTAPSGTPSLLAEPHRDTDSDYDNWKLMTVRHWDEPSIGDWRLTVSDLTDGTEGTHVSWELILHGTHGPLAQDDSAFTDPNTPVRIAVLANDSDVDDDALHMASVSDPAHGSVEMNPDQTVTYTPDLGFAGVDTFLYALSDTRNASDVATVTVTVAVGFGLTFDGGDDHADCGKGDGLNLTGPLTLEAWIRPSGWGERTIWGYGRVLDKDKFVVYLNNTSSNYNDHSLVFSMDLPDGSFVASNTPENSIALNAWHHLAVTYDGANEVRMYINGEEQTLHQPHDPPLGPIAENSGFPLLIGESGARDRAFEGAIDEVRVWNQVRTPADIQAGLHVGLKGNEEGLAGYWPMDWPWEGIKDHSGNGHDGAIFGATWDQGAPVQRPPNLRDAMQALRILAGGMSPALMLPIVREDGKVSMADAIRILQGLFK